MSNVVTLEINSEDFRQNYVPDRELILGHWMLGFAPARDLLKIKLLKLDPSAKVYLFSEKGADAAALDVKLDVMIDQMGLRDMAEPKGQVEEFFATAKFFAMLLRVQFAKQLP